MQDIVNLFHEIGMLAKTPRSGFAFLGTGRQSVADHSHRMTLVAYVLAKMSREPVNIEKLLLICLTHDLIEARTGDLNYVNQKYVHVDEQKILDEMQKESIFGEEIVAYLNEYNSKETLESKLAKDADQIELLLCLKEELDLGNLRASDWFDAACKRLVTDTAKELAKVIREVPSDAWWIKNKEDPHWVNGRKKK